MLLLLLCTESDARIAKTENAKTKEMLLLVLCTENVESTIQTHAEIPRTTNANTHHRKQNECDKDPEVMCAVLHRWSLYIYIYMDPFKGNNSFNRIKNFIPMWLHLEYGFC